MKNCDLMLMHNGSLYCIGGMPSWIFKIKFINGQRTLETYFASACKILLDRGHLWQRYCNFWHFSNEILFTRWSHLIQHNFVKVGDDWIHRYERTIGKKNFILKLSVIGEILPENLAGGGVKLMLQYHLSPKVFFGNNGRKKIMR